MRNWVWVGRGTKDGMQYYPHFNPEILTLRQNIAIPLIFQFFVGTGSVAVFNVRLFYAKYDTD
jgi:hypothetical protein